MAANAITYAQKNPQSLLRDVMFDLLPELEAQGLASPAIFGQTTDLGAQEGGRTVDMTNGGPLHGKLFVRNKRALLGAMFTDSGATKLSGQTIGAARSQIDTWEAAEVAYTMKQFAGMCREPIHHLNHGFLDPAREEVLMVQRASASIWLQKEDYAGRFFTSIAADGADAARPGWSEVNWTAGATGGTDLDSSTDFIQVMSSVIADARLRSGSPINAMYCNRSLIQKLAREASVLSRVFVENGASGAIDAATQKLKVGGFSGAPVLPFEAVIEVLKQHLSLSEVIVSSAMKQTGATASDRSYIWPSDRAWIGTAGASSVSLGAGNQPRLVSGAGSFVNLLGKVETAIGPEMANAPQFYEAVAEEFSCPVACDLEGGTVIYNLD